MIPIHNSPQVRTTVSGVVEALAIATELFDLTGQKPTATQVAAMSHLMNHQQLDIGYLALFDPFISKNEIANELVLSTFHTPATAYEASAISIPTFNEVAIAVQLVGIVL